MSRAKTPFELSERVAELRAWARNRIQWCVETLPQVSCPETRAARAAEARSLRAVLRILDGEEHGEVVA